MIRRIALLGTGLIGGSLGLAIKRTHADTFHIVGYDRPEMLDRALRLRAIDEPALEVEQAVRDADLVVLCTPLPTILVLLGEIAPHVKPGAIVTDVGSVKQPVVARAETVLPDHAVFVGGHPMAGAATGGIENADPLLFENAVYVLTPPSTTLPEAFAPAADLLTTIGARLLVLGAATHDRVAAAVSHLPQLLSVALVSAAFDVGKDEEAVQTLAAGGFRDMTRVADSPFDVWAGILAANHGNVLDALAAIAASVQRIRNRIIEEDFEDLRLMFENAASRRSAIPRDMRGFLHPLHYITVQAEDRPGSLHELTGALATAGINIKDLELLKIREGTGGTFRVGFATATEAHDASERLREAGFGTSPT